MKLAGKPLVGSDGSPIPLTSEDEADSKQEHVAIEYWGLAIPEGIWGHYGNISPHNNYKYPGRSAGNNTYKAVRVIGRGYNIYYSVWCTNESEFYDLKVGFSEPFCH